MPKFKSRKRPSLYDRFRSKDILSINDFNTMDLDIIFRAADLLEPVHQKRAPSNIMSGLVLGTLFFEPSTRTRLSFETAMLRLGGQVINVVGATSSLEKGESLSDMGRVVSCFADLIAMRHPTAFSVHELAGGATVPVINGGDGANEHPTQAMLDLYTIRKSQKKLTRLRVGFVGDLKYGRAALSLIRLLRLYDTRFVFVSHPSLRVPAEVMAEIRASGCEIQETTDLDSVIQELDVLYMTRVQKERFESQAVYDEVKNAYKIDLETLRYAKRSLSILHPLPRVDEIAKEVDADPRFRCFDQVENGVTIRMALLALAAGRLSKGEKRR